MELASPSTSSSLSAFRHRLRATVCCCLGQQGERVRWRRRRAGGGEFRYDPLSYALNFDEGDLLDGDGDEEEQEEEELVRAGRGGDGLLYHSLVLVAAADAGRGGRGRPGPLLGSTIKLARSLAAM